MLLPCGESTMSLSDRSALAMWTAAIAATIGVTASTAATKPILKASQEFSTPGLQVHSPAADGWFEESRSADEFVFAKRGASGDEWYIASVTLSYLPEFGNPGGFTDYVRRDFQRHTPWRVEIVTVEAQATAEREYPCVRLRSVFFYREVTLWLPKKVRHEMFSLSCRHPYRKNLGFLATYIHRGGPADEHLERAAASFIAGVQVPPQPSAGDAPP
jgi:hypothetical protein